MIKSVFINILKKGCRKLDYFKKLGYDTKADEAGDCQHNAQAQEDAQEVEDIKTLNFKEILVDVISVIYMDIYFLLKILSSSNFNYKYSIVYVGADHASLYDNFILRWYEVEPEIHIESEFSCLHFSEPFDFFQE